MTDRKATVIRTNAWQGMTEEEIAEFFNGPKVPNCDGESLSFEDFMNGTES